MLTIECLRSNAYGLHNVAKFKRWVRQCVCGIHTVNLLAVIRRISLNFSDILTESRSKQTKAPLEEDALYLLNNLSLRLSI